MKRVLVVVAQEGFQDYEYSVPRQIFEKEGFTVDVASRSQGKAKGKFGLEIEVDKALNDLNQQGYQAIVLVGGPGAVGYQKNVEINALLKQFVEVNKLVAAICIAPTILAFAGLLRNKKATVWNGDGEQSKVLENNGAEYKREGVVVDGKIITADGPDSAEKFVKEIIQLLNKENNNS